MLGCGHKGDRRIRSLYACREPPKSLNSETRIIRTVMPTMYFGVICPNGHFILLRTYHGEHAQARYDAVTLDHPTEFRCDHCGTASLYQQTDVAYSNSADGKQFYYSFR
jgi:hypothetical protein